jgi:hypothetical protein
MRASFGVHDLLDPIAARMPRAVIAADPRCRPASPVVDPAVRDSDSAEPVTQMPNVGRSS